MELKLIHEASSACIALQEDIISNTNIPGPREYLCLSLFSPKKGIFCALFYMS